MKVAIVSCTHAVSIGELAAYQRELPDGLHTFKEVDALYLNLDETSAVESEEISPAAILDYK